MKSDKGFIKLIILIIIVLVILGYFGFDVRKIFTTPAVHDNLAYVWHLIVTFWNNFIAAPLALLWHKIFG